MHHKALAVIDRTDYLLLKDLALLIPGKPSYWTLLRWSEKGAKNSKGKQVFLATVKLPAGKGSSLELYDAFLEKLNE